MFSDRRIKLWKDSLGRLPDLFAAWHDGASANNRMARVMRTVVLANIAVEKGMRCFVGYITLRCNAYNKHIILCRKQSYVSTL